MHRLLRGLAAQGNVLVLTCFLMIVMIAFIALTVDVGYLYTVRNELQRSADAAAIAATWELVAEDTMAPISASTVSPPMPAPQPWSLPP